MRLRVLQIDILNWKLQSRYFCFFVYLITFLCRGINCFWKFYIILSCVVVAVYNFFRCITIQYIIIQHQRSKNYEHSLLSLLAAKGLLATLCWGHWATSGLWEDVWQPCWIRAAEFFLLLWRAASSHFPYEKFPLWDSRLKKNTYSQDVLRQLRHRKTMFYEFISIDLKEWTI